MYRSRFVHRRENVENSYRSKGDSLWKIAEKYGVDLEELKTESSA